MLPNYEKKRYEKRHLSIKMCSELKRARKKLDKHARRRSFGNVGEVCADGCLFQGHRAVIIIRCT